MHPDAPLPSRGLNPFNYSPAEIVKALIAAVGFLGFAAVYLINTGWDPALVPALESLVPAGAAVVMVFVSKNDTADDYSKAVIGFVTAIYGVFRFFPQVHLPDISVIVVLIGYAATFVAVAAKGNQTPIDDQRATATSS